MSRVKNELELAVAQRMRALGIPLDQKESKERVLVSQDRTPLVNIIATKYLSSRSLGTAITTYVTIVNNSEIPLALCGIQLNLPWKDAPAILLQDPADDFSPQVYRFPGEMDGGFDRSDMLPHTGVTLRFGRSVEGFIFAYDLDPVPPGFRHGQEVPVLLVIEDQFGELYERELLLAVDRTVERGPKPKPHRPQRKGSLFDKRDFSRDESPSPSQTEQGALPVSHRGTAEKE
jgi:hypothetical protein